LLKIKLKPSLKEVLLCYKLIFQKKLTYLAKIYSMENQSYSAYPIENTHLFAELPIVYGTFWERFLAAIIDGLILSIPNMLLKYMYGNTSFIYAAILGWLYYAIQESGNNQATIGKKAMGLKVTDTDRQRISFGKATGRHFGKYVSTIIIFWGYVMMIWDDRKQTLHDKMAGTLVVKG
jgi:uncharacterized RDD family membrane protein YckC